MEKKKKEYRERHARSLGGLSSNVRESELFDEMNIMRARHASQLMEEVAKVASRAAAAGPHANYHESSGVFQPTRSGIISSGVLTSGVLGSGVLGFGQASNQKDWLTPQEVDTNLQPVGYSDIYSSLENSEPAANAEPANRGSAHERGEDGYPEDPPSSSGVWDPVPDMNFPPSQDLSGKVSPPERSERTLYSQPSSSGNAGGKIVRRSQAGSQKTQRQHSAPLDFSRSALLTLETSVSLSSDSSISSGKISAHNEQMTMAGSKEPSMYSGPGFLDVGDFQFESPMPSPRGPVRVPPAVGPHVPPPSGVLTPFVSESRQALEPGFGGVSEAVPGRHQNVVVESPSEEELANAHFHLPQSVLATVAASLQSDVTIASFLVQRDAETVLCEPRGLITLPVRMSQKLLECSVGKVVDTDKLLLPSILTAALGSRPKRYLGVKFSAEGYEGLCYCLWMDPARVPVNADMLLSDAARALPFLLANRVRALCGERMGRRFDAILTRMPQAVIFLEDSPEEQAGGHAGDSSGDQGALGPCLINPAAADLLELPQAGEVDPALVAMAMRELAERSPDKADIFGWFRRLLEQPHDSIEGYWELSEPRCILKMWTFPINGQLTQGRVWLFDDVTAEHDVRSAVEEADKAKSNFLAMMSHQLRTPMTGVLGVLDLLRLTPLTAEQSGFVRVMQSSAEGLLHVLNEILDFSKIESGHLKLEETDFHVQELLEQVSALFQGRLQEKKLDLTVDLPYKEDLSARGDPIRLQQILNNLLSNAIKFTESGSIHISWKRIPPPNPQSTRGSRFPAKAKSANQGPPLRGDMSRNLSGPLPPPSRGSSLSTRLADVLAREESERAIAGRLAMEADARRMAPVREDNDSSNFQPPPEPHQARKVWYEVRVQDTGIGLTEEQQRRLFKSFSQADSSTTRRFGGSGLGLAVCKGLVNAMGGVIWVESRPGVGSTFAFNVPLHRAQDPSKMATHFGAGPLPGPGPGSGTGLAPGPGSGVMPVCVPETNILSVLVAEDNMVNQMLIRKMLRHYGHKVHLVANGQLAVEAVRERAWDMVLMDIQMPVMDGLEATTAIRQLPPPLCQIPIYALTADVLTKASGTLEEMGLDGYLTKPIDWDSLHGVLQKVIQSRD